MKLRIKIYETVENSNFEDLITYGDIEIDETNVNALDIVPLLLYNCKEGYEVKEKDLGTTIRLF